MKRIKFYLPVLIGFLHSCERETSKTATFNRNESNLKTAILSTSSPASFTSSPDAILNLLKYPADLEDEKLFLQIYQIAGGLCNVVRTNSLLSNIYSRLDTLNNKNEIDIDALIQSNKKLKENIESFTRRVDATNTYDQVTSKFIKNNISYLPLICIPNARTADFSKKPIIAIGTDFAWQNDDFEDYIPGWEINDNNDLKEIVLCEKDAMNSKCPIIIVTFKIATDSKLENISQNTAIDKIVYQSYLFQQPFAREYMIISRYDRSNHSEYRYTEKIYNTDNTNYVDQETIDDIHKSEMGQLFTGGGISINSETNTWYTYLATFEYDWYTSKKSIAVAGINGVQYLEAKMSGYNEYYQRLSWDWRYAVPPFISSSPEGIIKINY